MEQQRGRAAAQAWRGAFRVSVGLIAVGETHPDGSGNRLAWSVGGGEPAAARDPVATRLATYEGHAQAVTEQFAGCAQSIDASRPPAEVFADIAALLDGHGWGGSEECPYLGSKAFGGAFSEREARRARGVCDLLAPTPDAPPM